MAYNADMSEGRMAKVDALLDRTEILDCIHRYTRGMDRLDRALVRSAYHDGAVDEHVGFIGVVDDFIDWTFQYHSAQIRHQHYVMNHSVELNGDVAHTETYYLFVGTDREPMDGPLLLVGGRYIDRLERRAGRWGIAVRNCSVEWQTSVATGLPQAAFEILSEMSTVARDRSDTSYDRPLALKRFPAA
jgi:hypothetical protein